MPTIKAHDLLVIIVGYNILYLFIYLCWFVYTSFDYLYCNI